MKYELVIGDILEQDVEVIVNSWNRNFIPWFLLLPQGVSKSIKKKRGYKPFNELLTMGMIPLGGAVITSSGRLSNQYKSIIHVAGINCLWFRTKKSIEDSIKNSIKLAEENEFKSIAIPIIGSGSGNRQKRFALSVIEDTLKSLESDLIVKLVKFS